MKEQTAASVEVGVLGTGRMGVRLAKMFAQAGRSVVLASRSPDRARKIVDALAIPGLTAGSYNVAVAAQALLPAVFVRDGLLELLAPWRNELSGKLLIDIANPFNEDYSDFILPWDTSAAEVMQEALPEARVVGAFKNVFWEVFDAPVLEGQQSDVLYVGNDADAKRRFTDLVEGTPFRYLDAGGLTQARTIERLTLITSRLGQQLGTYPRMNWRLLGDAQASQHRDRHGIDSLIST